MKEDYSYWSQITPMDSAKVIHYQKENPGGSFPPFDTLSQEETNKCFQIFCSTINLNPSKTLSASDIESRFLAVTPSGLNVHPGTLCDVLSRLHINTDKDTWVTCDHFGTVDRMRLVDLVNFVDWIWRPGAEDVIIIDCERQWILMIHHEECVMLASPRDRI